MEKNGNMLPSYCQSKEDGICSLPIGSCTQCSQSMMPIIDYLKATIKPTIIYVENVRSHFNISRFNAESICEEGVKSGILTKKTQIKCPQCKRVLLTINYSDKVPETLYCELCELAEEEVYNFHPSHRDLIFCYQFNPLTGKNYLIR